MIFPFVAIEGQKMIKKALLFNIINDKIAGVLISGEKGTAKSTLVRGLNDLFPEKKIINLPLNITEDNLVGSIDIEKTIKCGRKIFQEGLLKKCHNNILYIDEINLISDSIANILMEVFSRKENYIEREGISVSHKCDFILIGTMNPEEGNLRTELLDKFGLYVYSNASKDVLERVKIIKKRLEFEKNPLKFYETYIEERDIIRQKIKQAKKRLSKIKLNDSILNIAVKMVEEANISGNRAEIILVETAKTIAVYDGRTYVNIDDLKEAALYVFPHRIRQNNDSISQQSKNSKKEEQTDITKENYVDNNKNQSNNKSSQNIENKDINKKFKNDYTERNFKIEEVFKVKDLLLNKSFDRKKRIGTGKRAKTKTSSFQGRYIKSIFPKGLIQDLALVPTIRAAAIHKIKEVNDLAINIKKEDIRVKVREKRIGTSILFVVDSSGSMGVNRRMEAVKGAIMSLLKDAYEKRDKVGMLSFRKDRAEELLPITRSIDLAKKKLENLTVGGKTPLSAGILKAYILIKNEMKKDKDILPLIIFLTDGKANFSSYGKNPVKESLEMAVKIRNEKIHSIIIDTEEDFIKLEMAKTLSEKMGADYYKLENIKSEDILKLIKNRI